MIKKMMLLAVAAAAVIAFAVPATASANLVWSEEGEIAGTGQLTSVSESGVVTGPAPVSFAAEVAGSEGAITEFNIEGTVPTNVPFCTAVGSVHATPWEAHLTTPDTMTITDVTFMNHYSGPGCEAAGIPPTVPVTGDVTFTVTGGNSASAEPYDDSTSLFVEGTAIGVDIRGAVSWTGPSIEGL